MLMVFFNTNKYPRKQVAPGDNLSPATPRYSAYQDKLSINVWRKISQ